jgi:hypothetical protein
VRWIRGVASFVGLCRRQWARADSN